MAVSMKRLIEELEKKKPVEINFVYMSDNGEFEVDIGGVKYWGIASPYFMEKAKKIRQKSSGKAFAYLKKNAFEIKKQDP